LLGRFLEFSLPTPDIQASFNFYRKLGFSDLSTGEAWRHPYAAVTDGRLCLGLHQAADLPPTLTFVKPQLLKALEPLETLGLQFDYRHLADDVFNEVGFKDPSGQPVRLVEARTFSPVKRAGGEYSSLGYFAEIALPAADFDGVKTFWEHLGFVGMEEFDDPLPHISCTSDSVDLGLYEPGHLRVPTLKFEVDDLKATLSRLGALDIEVRGQVPGGLRGRAALLHAPEGTPILIVAP
jgi:catechol 2,3-dioxygenase-like lactoylglutathione lyase family enzyme